MQRHPIRVFFRQQRSNHLFDMDSQTITGWVCKWDVGGNPITEKGVILTALRTVNKLIHQYHITRCQFFFETSNRRNGKDRFYPLYLQRIDICPVIELSWQNTVTFAMARKR